MAGKCIIFCAAQFDGPVCPVGHQDLVIAADGGLRHTQALGLTPQVILGDFDSLGYIPQGAQVFPVEKDDTDSMLALRLGLERGYRTFLLYGAMDGPRLDHTLANLQALTFLAEQGARGYLVGRHQIAAAFREKLTLPPSFTGTFSLFALGPAVQVTLRGAKYTLEGGVLTPGFPLGVSNAFVGEKCEIIPENGVLTLLWERNNGLLEETL